MRVFDVFPFYNELDLLELRLLELDPVVDVFGLVELPVTFTGIPKPLYFRTNPQRFEPWIEKIRFKTPPAYPEGGHPLVDWFQRRQLARLFADAAPDDLIIMGDVDEIPNREVIRQLRENPPGYPVVLLQDLYYHRVTLRGPEPWCGTIVTPRKSLGPEPDTQELRDNRTHFEPIPNGGWHFSWMGSVEQIRDKLKAVDILREADIYNTPHVNKLPPTDDEFLESCRQGADLLQRGGHERFFVDLIPGRFQPHDIKEWLEKYPVYA